MKDGRTQGEIEATIRNAIIKFEQEFMGRGPEEVRAFVLRDVILVRLKGVLTQAEKQLAKTENGIDTVRRLRHQLISQGRERLCSQVEAITGAAVTGLFTDIDTQIGERIIVFTVDRDLEPSFR